MDAITLLAQLGLGLATNAVYDLIMHLSDKEIAADELVTEIQNRIDLHGVNMNAEGVISALAQNGFISIKGSYLHANESLVFGSEAGGASVGNDSKLTTDKTAIETKGNASMNTVGNAQVRQNADGSISFHVGEDGNINIKT
jgi:hypothetical protein